MNDANKGPQISIIQYMFWLNFQKLYVAKVVNIKMYTTKIMNGNQTQLYTNNDITSQQKSRRGQLGNNDEQNV